MEGKSYALNKHFARKAHSCMLCKNNIYKKKSRFINIQHVKRKLVLVINIKKGKLQTMKPCGWNQTQSWIALLQNMWSFLLVQFLYNSFTPLLTFSQRLGGCGRRTWLLGRGAGHIPEVRGKMTLSGFHSFEEGSTLAESRSLAQT